MDKKGGRASSKSPSRSKKTARPKSKSPGRQKSPARKSPARTKSPARAKSPSKPKSPASPKKSSVKGRPRRSPARKSSPGRKEKASASPARKISPTPVVIDRPTQELRSSPFVRLERQEEAASKSLKNEEKVTRDRSASLPKPSTSASLSNRAYTEEASVIRRSSRLKQNESEKSFKSNNVPQYERKHGEKPSREFGNWPGALVAMFVLPAVALLLQVSCNKSKCSGLVTPNSNWKVYLDLHSFGFYVGYAVWIAVVSSLPVGRKTSYTHVHTRLMSFYSALLTAIAIGGLYYYGFNVTSVLGKSVALLSSAVLFALLLSFVLFFKSRRSTTGLNVNADGNIVYDFFIGRELFPTVGPLSIKTWIVRMEVVGILLLDALYLLKYVETHAAGIHSPTLLFTVIAHSIYALDALWFEEQFMTSYEAQYEGVGYMSLMAAATWPFLFTLSTRYIVYTNYEAPTYLLAICGIIFALSYFVYRASNSQKAEFRKNPQHPVFSKVETIPTIHGKRLLCGGWWGRIRHPNYTSDIVMMWSMASVCALSHWLPYFFPALHLLVLIHRTYRVETRCKNLYTAAWNRYTEISKHRLLPGVF